MIAGAGGTLADRYSREACKKLKVEYADVLARGIPQDMEQGPEWARANLDLRRLKNVDQLIDLEADLEFRCRMSRKRIAAIRPERKPVIPDIPERKVLPDPPSQTAEAEEGPDAKPAASPATAETAAIDPKTGSAKPKTSTSRGEGAATKDAKPGAKPSKEPAAKSAETKSEVASQEPAPKPSVPKKKKKRANAYVSPREVAPYGLYRYGSGP